MQGAIELAGGLLLAVGFLTRPVAFILADDMAVAYFMAHAPKNFFPVLNGGDAAILYCFTILLFFVAGPGRWSIDRANSVNRLVLAWRFGRRVWSQAEKVEYALDEVNDPTAHGIHQGQD